VTYPNTNKVEYLYNVASELTTVPYKKGATTLGTLTYTYDAAGNRIKTGGTFARSNIPPALATTSYNANNQQTAFGAATETYDLNGNLATFTDASGTTTYTWNARNQLTAISGPGLTGSFTYDSFGRRTGKTINATTTNFVYDGFNPVQEKAGGTVTANLLTGLGIDEFFTRTDGVGVRSLLPDALGSTVALGDGTGTLQTQYTYEPFGVTTQTGAASTSSYKYTGREDDGTGLIYYRARYYHPRLQRFVAEDPIGFEGGDVNAYAYASDNPIMYSDPYGLFSIGDLPLLPPGAVNFSAGLGDTLLLGFGGNLRALLGINVGIDSCDDYYQYGSWASFGAGGARLAYAGIAKGYSLMAASGAAASAFRAQVGTYFRLGFGRGWRQPNLAKYINDDELRAAAGRTNFPLNVYALGVATVGGVNGSGCGCP
jgi:RHS repeat-associated protein